MRVRARGHTSSQVADGVRGDAAYGRCPFRVLGLTVPLTHEVGAEGVEPDTILVQECWVVEALVKQHVGQTQHQCGVGVGVRRQPFRLEEVRGVVLYGADVHELDAVLLATLEPTACGMLAQAPGADLSILERESPETHHKLRMPGDHRPRGGFAADGRPAVSKDMGDDDFPRRKAVGVHRPDIAAQLVQEAVELALSVVETTRGGPAVGAAEDSRVPEGLPYSPQLAGHQVKRLVPAHGNEGLRTAAPALMPGSSLQPTLAYHGLRDPAVVVHHAGNRLPDWRGIRVIGKRVCRHDASGPDLDLVSAPVKGRLNVFGVCVVHLRLRLPGWKIP